MLISIYTIEKITVSDRIVLRSYADLIERSRVVLQNSSIKRPDHGDRKLGGDYAQARLAQSVERTTLNRVVVGSIPTMSEIFFSVVNLSTAVLKSSTEVI